MNLGTRRRLLALALLLPVVSGGCGAGLVTGIASSGGGSNASQPPRLSIAPGMPLVPVAGSTRSVLVTNALIPPAASLRVTLTALGQTVEQHNPTVSGQSGSTQVTFELDTAAILAVVGTPTAADIAAELRVLVDGREVAQPAPIVLLRQPRAVLGLPATESRFVSPLGERVTVYVEGLASTDLSALQMLVTTRDPESADPAATVTRVCSGLGFEVLPPGRQDLVGFVGLSALVPGTTYPMRAALSVRDAVAGQSTSIENAYYRPEISEAQPSQGPTTGGDILVLTGKALVPLDFTAPGASKPLAFGAVTLSLKKGGEPPRRIVVSPQDLRTESSSSERLVFTMPASPDGRPGQVDIELKVELGDVTAEDSASQVFLFANPQPFFGPRGIVLDRPPVAVAPIGLDKAPAPATVDDFAVLTERAGVAYLQLMLAQENGMFQPFAVPRQIGDHEAAAEHGPRDLCVGNFNDDQVPDLFVANAGAATAVHHVVLGRARPATPLGAVFPFAAQPGTAHCRAARIDGDPRDDVLLVPGPEAPVGALPQVWLARPLPDGSPAFAAPIDLPVRPLRYEAFEIADLDGDEFLDIALLVGSTLQLDIAWGDGLGGFTSTSLDFQVGGYTPATTSPAVGLHACADQSLQSLAVVLAGILGSGATQPAVALLRQSSLRVFEPPANGSTLFIPLDPFGYSLAADLDRTPPMELALAASGDAQFASLGMARFTPGGFQLVGSVDTGSEKPLQIRGLYFGAAFPSTPSLLAKDAVFVVHESQIDGARERRLSTRLIVANPTTGFLKLLPPDAGLEFPDPIEAVVSGNFHPTSIAGGDRVRDLALARPGIVDLIENDGYGGFPGQSDSLVSPGLLPGSLQLLAAPPGQADWLTFCDAQSHVGLWRRKLQGTTDPVPDWLTGELRLASSNQALRSTNLRNTTLLRTGDVDGDGVMDLVALLSFDVATPGAGDSALALLRGNPSPAENEPPFFEPTVLTPVHGNASSLVLGDFAAEEGTGGPVQLEVAVAIPVGSQPGALDGDHVLFFRYHAGATPAADWFAPSAVPSGPQTLFAGSEPRELAAADLDLDGRTDLLVSCAGDDNLRLFRNLRLPGGGSPEVDVGAFVESQTSPTPLPEGSQPTALRLGDVNGDGKPDAIETLYFPGAGAVPPRAAVVFMLNSGSGDFGAFQFVSDTRVGDPLFHGARLALDLGDWNRDGVADLFLGWAGVVAEKPNLRILFGGTR